MGCVLCGLLNVDTVSVWVTVCCSLRSNGLDEDFCNMIVAQAPSGCGVSCEDEGSTSEDEEGFT